MKDLAYNQLNILISVYETRLLSPEIFEKMISSINAETAFAVLRDTNYGVFLQDGVDVYQFEAILEAELEQTYRMLYASAPDRTLVDFFAMRYDYHNLKVLVKAYYTGQDFDSMLLPLGSYNHQDLRNLIYEKKSAIIHDVMVECVQDVLDYLETYQDIQNINIIFDSYYWKHLQSLAKAFNDDTLNRMLENQINIFNISAILRGHLMGRRHGFMSSVIVEGGTFPTDELVGAIDDSLETFVEYLQNTSYKKLIENSYEEIKQSKTLAQFDLLRDNYMINYLTQTRLEPFGTSALFRYIFIKETEIKNLRTVLICKINHVDGKIIQDRMRDIYV